MSAADDRYNHSPKGRARNARYDASQRGRARHARYDWSEKGQARRYAEYLRVLRARIVANRARLDAYYRGEPWADRGQA